jgi:inhibitor of KinA sporulation pathway (predicted exonuclease)
MDIYFDFEATQFSERVIAIGASCEYGDFDCLVGLRKGDKLTNFITNLTGITKEMLIGAPKAKQAFSDLYNWICEMCAESNTPVFYHCYGDSDPIFLINTANKMDDSEIRDFVLNLANSLLDDSHKVKKFFHSKSIGLHKALKYFEPDISDQTHDPLDDAIELRKLMTYIKNSPPLIESPFEEQKIIEAPKAPPHIIKLTHAKNKEAKPKYFKSKEQAITWAYNRIVKSQPKANKKTVAHNVSKALTNHTPYMDWYWIKEK